MKLCPILINMSYLKIAFQPIQVSSIFKMAAQMAAKIALTLNHNNCRLLCHLLVILKAIFANSVDPDQTAPLGFDLGPHCLPVCKNRFEKFARIFSRR